MLKAPYTSSFTPHTLGLQALGTCESLDPREGRWRQEADLLYHRAYAAATSAGDCMFVGGGNFGISYLDTVEMFDAVLRLLALPVSKCKY
jgi:hypothetical protein